MARPSRIIQLGLEKTVIRERAKHHSMEKIVATLNRQLDKRRSAGEKVGGPIPVNTLGRYLRSLDAASAPALHTVEVVQANTRLSINFGDQFLELNATMNVWLEEAKTARKMVAVAGVGVEDAGPDWDARVKTATALQRNLDSYADLLERIFDADQVRMFREEVLTAISEESPECARRIQARLQARQSVRIAALTGGAA